MESNQKEIAKAFLEGEKIAEMWDISQEVTQDSPNENGVL